MKKVPAGTCDCHIHFYRPQDRYPVAPTSPFPPPNAPVRKYREVMKDGAYFINASRGNLVDAAALERALTNRRVAGAAMDVGSAHNQKPSPGLARLPNVIATPHVGGQTPGAIESQALETVEQIRAVSEGVLPHNAINPDRAFRFAEFIQRRSEGAGS